MTTAGEYFSRRSFPAVLMSLEILREPEIPEDVLRLLATPVSRSLQTWYLGSKTTLAAPQWLIATLWNEPALDNATATCWGISLRGAAEPSLVRGLVHAIAGMASTLGCHVLKTDARIIGEPFDTLLQDAGFSPFRAYRTVQASTIAAFRALGLGVRGTSLEASGWSIGPPLSEELSLLVAMFMHELGQIPPHLLHLIEYPEQARTLDQSLVLRRHGQPVAAIAARRIDRTIDTQGLLCHPRWRNHRAFSWLLAESTAGWPLVADNIVFSFPENNAGMVDIARRIGAQPLVRRHDLILRPST